MVASIERKVDPFSQTGIGEEGRTEITTAAARACTTLKLVESAEIVGVIGIKAIKTLNADSVRFIEIG